MLGMQLRLRFELVCVYIKQEFKLRKCQKMRTKNFHPTLCHIVRNLALTHIITLIAVSVCILWPFFIETMTTTLPYESRTSKMQQEQVIQCDCRNTNTNFNHDISPYHNSNPRYNIGISRCKGTGPFLSPLS